MCGFRVGFVIVEESRFPQNAEFNMNTAIRCHYHPCNLCYNLSLWLPYLPQSRQPYIPVLNSSFPPI